MKKRSKKLKTIRVFATERNGVVGFLKRELLRLTAPRELRAFWCGKSRGGRKVRICDMDDAHLLNTIRFLRRAFATVEYTAREYLDVKRLMLREAARRGLPTDRKPAWLEKINTAYGEKRRAQIRARNERALDRIFGGVGTMDGGLFG